MSDPNNAQALSWHGNIPCCLSLSPHDLADITPPAPHYIMLPRLSYLHVAAASVIASLLTSSLSSLENGGVWFSHNKVPLDWHLPIGVLFDKIALNADLASHTTPQLLPLELTVHFSSYPDTLLQYTSQTPTDLSTVRQHFAQSLKQSLFLEHGNSRTANNLSKAKSESLWSAVTSNDFVLYSSINDQLLADVTQSITTSTEDTRTEEEILRDETRERLTLEALPLDSLPAPPVKEIKNIPVRLVNSSTGETIQRPITTGTLKDHLHLCLDDRDVKVCVNGLYDVPGTIPIAELWRCCQMPDHFLYVVFKQ